MENGEWRIENGELRIESGEWRIGVAASIVRRGSNNISGLG